MSKPYDIEKAFSDIESSIISSMIDRFRRDRPSGRVGAYQWQDWRIRQLKAAKAFEKAAQNRIKKLYYRLNDLIRRLIGQSFDDALRDAVAEHAINTTVKMTPDASGDEFFDINRTRIQALQDATVKDLQRVEGAVFRKTDDAYRQIIYKAQMGLNSGLLTYEQAVDAATKDFLTAGINCVVYKNGARHTVKDYARMILRTTMKRAALMAEGEMRTKLGIHTVYARWRDTACPECMRFLGRIMVDDVYSVGTRAEAEAGGYLLLSDAMADGFLHPNCRDTITTYDPERWKNDPKNDPLRKTLARRQEYERKAAQNEKNEQALEAARLRLQKWDRLASNQLDPKNRADYTNLAKNAKQDIADAMQKIADTQGLDGYERAIANEPVEWMGVFHKSRRTGVISAKTHTDWREDSVRGVGYAYGDKFTHNHPVEGDWSLHGFSAQDVDAASMLGVREARARWFGGVHILKRKHDWSTKYSDYVKDVERPPLTVARGECFSKFGEAYRLAFGRIDRKWQKWAIGEMQRWYATHPHPSRGHIHHKQIDVMRKREQFEEQELEAWMTKNAPIYGWTYESRTI